MAKPKDVEMLTQAAATAAENLPVVVTPGQAPVPPNDPAQVTAKPTIEQHKVNHEVEGNHVPLWKHEAAKAMKKWPIGAEITREAYDAALADVENIRLS